MSKTKVTNVYTIRITGAELTLIVAALMFLNFPGSKELAVRILKMRVTK